MNDIIEFVARAVVIGAGAAALMDVWALVLRKRFGVSTLDYAMLGRWMGHMRHGQFAHQRIASAAPVRFERAIGWLAHYGIGVTFAMLLLGVAGREWAQAPTLWPPMLIGLATIAAPWFLMQPGMGAGIAGSRSANPTATRLRNLGTHAVYGLGLYLGALLLAVL